MGRLDTLGIVVGVLDAAFDVLIVKYNIIRRCYVAVSLFFDYFAIFN